MPEQYTYLLVDFWCIIFPLAFSFYPKFRFYKEWRYFALPCLATALFFIVWDIAFTYIGVWSFNHRYVCGLYYFGLPIEEYLFFICIPYASVFTYYCINVFFKFRGNYEWVHKVSWMLVVFLLGVALTHLHQLYTSVTFILLAMLLTYLTLKKVTYMPAFYVSFLLILIPFFISNGVLTGSFIGRTVVSYNSNYNLGIRMLTIPVEDTFYGMLLLLMNTAGMEFTKRYNANNNISRL